MASLTEPIQVGKREDFADVIAMVDYKDTPFTSMCPKGTEPANSLYDWQMDSYPAPALGGIVDGVDVQTSDYVNPASRRAKAHGRIQKFRSAFMVSDLAQNVSDVAGVGKRGEMQRAVKMVIVQIKRNMEGTFCSDQDSSADNGTVPYLTRGLGAWVNAGEVTITDTATQCPAAFATPAGSVITKTTATTLETDINNLQQSVYSQTGQQKDFDLICGTALKVLFSG